MCTFGRGLTRVAALVDRAGSNLESFPTAVGDEGDEFGHDGHDGRDAYVKGEKRLS